MDDWIEALRQECDRTSQNQAAKRLGVSPAMISQVLKGKYPAGTYSLEGRVRGELMGECVECPALGEISRKICLDWQARPFSLASPLHVRVYRACRGGCIHSQISQLA